MDGATQEEGTVSTSYWEIVLRASMPSLLQSDDSRGLEQKLDSLYDEKATAVPYAAAEVTTQHRGDQRAILRECWNNSFSTTSDLPTEILEHIFQDLYRASKELYWGLPANIPLDSIRISRVCRRWREIALSRGTLWNDLSTLMPKFLWDAHLARSRACLLDVKCMWPPENTDYITDIIAVYPRIQSLFVASCSDQDVVEDLGPAFLLKSPHLHTLDIASVHRLWLNRTFHEYLVHRAPALRSLSLSHRIFPWGSTLAHLRSLRLSSTMYGDDTDGDILDLSHTFEDVLHTLRGAQSLEILDIWGDVVFAAPSELPWPTISSPLKRLTLEGPVYRVCGLLAAFQASSSLQAKLVSEEYESDYDSDDPEDVEPEDMEDQSTAAARASDVLRRHLSSRSLQGLPEFTVLHMIVDDARLTMRLGFEMVPVSTLSTTGTSTTRPTSEQLTSDSDLPYVDFRLTFKSAHRGHAESIIAKTSKLSRSITTAQLQCLQHLVLSALCWHEQDIERVFQHAYNVESLTVYSTYGPDEYQAAALVAQLVCESVPMLEATSSDIDAAAGKVDLKPFKEPKFLPRLRALHITGVALNHVVEYNGRLLTLIDALTRGLRGRHRTTKRRLQTLHLEDCGRIAERDIELWVDCVSRVTID
ncbi:unnamed protein product [Peniophora sp. CBMAI 1063]|nr:unnamed protein product [Peniophora sp. CBMAI 1063]